MLPPSQPSDPSIRQSFRRLRSLPRLPTAPGSAPGFPIRPPAAGRPLFHALTLGLARALAALWGPGSRPLSSALTFSLRDPVSLCLSVSASSGGLSGWGPQSATVGRSLRRLPEPRAELAGVPSHPFRGLPGGWGVWPGDAECAQNQHRRWPLTLPSVPRTVLSLALPTALVFRLWPPALPLPLPTAGFWLFSVCLPRVSAAFGVGV